MTAIVAVTDRTNVVVGGDSAASSSHEIYTRSTRKVFATEAYTVGFTRSWRMGQILRHLTTFPEPPYTEDAEALEHFMIVKLVPAIRESFREHGFAKTAKVTRTPGYTEEGQHVGGVFLVAVRGHIFEIREDYQVVRPETPFAAIGCGSIAALGALHALTAHSTLSLRDKAQAALDAAAMYTQSVRGPFHFVEREG